MSYRQTDFDATHLDVLPNIGLGVDDAHIRLICTSVD